jgi:hypothetical protein
MTVRTVANLRLSARMTLDLEQRSWTYLYHQRLRFKCLMLQFGSGTGNGMERWPPTQTFSESQGCQREPQTIGASLPVDPRTTRATSPVSGPLGV